MTTAAQRLAARNRAIATLVAVDERLVTLIGTAADTAAPSLRLAAEVRDLLAQRAELVDTIADLNAQPAPLPFTESDPS